MAMAPAMAHAARGRDGGGAEAAAAEGEGGGARAGHLVCVPGGLRPSASLALLREAVNPTLTLT